MISSHFNCQSGVFWFNQSDSILLWDMHSWPDSLVLSGRGTQDVQFVSMQMTVSVHWFPLPVASKGPIRSTAVKSIGTFWISKCSCTYFGVCKFIRRHWRQCPHKDCSLLPESFQIKLCFQHLYSQVELLCPCPE